MEMKDGWWGRASVLSVLVVPLEEAKAKATSSLPVVLASVVEVETEAKMEMWAVSLVKVCGLVLGSPCAFSEEAWVEEGMLLGPSHPHQAILLEPQYAHLWALLCEHRLALCQHLWAPSALCPLPFYHPW